MIVPGSPILARNGFDIFSGKVNNAQRSARFRFGSVVPRFGRVTMHSSKEISVVEGPFEGQFGLWFVNNHDAQVYCMPLQMRIVLR